jgi:hypothetical protein
MKIENEVIIRALQQEEARGKPRINTAGTARPEAFESLLAGHLQKSADDGIPPASPARTDALNGRDAISAALLVQSAAVPNRADDEADPEEGLTAGSIDKLLNKWEEYAQALNPRNADNLRDAHTLLQGMSAELRDIKTTRQDILAKNATLDSLVNELDVLTTVETIKFNRGDYL